MIKVENDMLVLDSTFTKEDVKAIDEFVKINVDKERERIIKLWNDWCDEIHPEQEVEMIKLQADWTTEQTREFFIALINGENK